MGLLLGDVTPTAAGPVPFAWDVLVLTRIDRQRDRVEISPQQLAEAAQLAEAKTNETGVPTRVIGWYHSHPHITVEPSHVDVRTQGMYQMMDENFIGLIFSCFQDATSSRVGRMQVTAFQSGQGPAPMAIDNTTVDLAGASPVAAPSSPAPSGSGALADIVSPSTMALLSPSAKMASPGEQAWRPTLRIVPTPPHASSEWRHLVKLHRVLLEEEAKAYAHHLQLAQGAGNVALSPVLMAHHSNIYGNALCKHIEYNLYPLHAALEARKLCNEDKLKELRAKASSMADTQQQSMEM